MNLNDYVVAIPSYKRPQTLKKKSLSDYFHFPLEERRRSNIGDAHFHFWPTTAASASIARLADAPVCWA